MEAGQKMDSGHHEDSNYSRNIQAIYLTIN